MSSAPSPKADRLRELREIRQAQRNLPKSVALGEIVVPGSALAVPAPAIELAQVQP